MGKCCKKIKFIFFHMAIMAIKETAKPEYGIRDSKVESATCQAGVRQKGRTHRKL